VSGEEQPAQVCRDLHLIDGMLALRRNEYAERGTAIYASQTPASLPTSLEAQIAELERFCGHLT
jgi:hypothetical protein